MPAGNHHIPSRPCARIVRCGRLCAAIAVAVFVLVAALRPSTAAELISLDSGRPNLAVYLLNGSIAGGETLKLEAIVAKLPAGTTVAVILNSPGGSLGEGLSLGRFFHEARIPTFVLGYGGSCYSACSLAFLGGRQGDGRPSRTKMTGSELGFHQFRQARTAEERNKKYSKTDMEQAALRTRATAMLIIQYLTDIGEDLSILHLMLKAPASDMTLLDNSEAVTYGINVMDEHTDQVIDASAVRARIQDR